MKKNGSAITLSGVIALLLLLSVAPTATAENKNQVHNTNLSSELLAPFQGLKLLHTTETGTEGAYRNGELLIHFKCQMLQPNVYEFTFGEPGQQVRKHVNYNTGEVVASVDNDKMIFTKELINAYPEIAQQLQSLIENHLIDLVHNQLILTMFQFYGRAPVGHVFTDGKVFD